MAIIGTAVAAAIGIIIGKITTADGAGGTVTGGVLRGLTSCSLAALASPGGGAGAGALGPAGAGAAAGAGVAAGAGAEIGDPPTATMTVTVILIIVADPAIPITAMATDTVLSTSLH